MLFGAATTAASLAEAALLLLFLFEGKKSPGKLPQPPGNIHGGAEQKTAPHGEKGGGREGEAFSIP